MSMRLLLMAQILGMSVAAQGNFDYERRWAEFQGQGFAEGTIDEYLEGVPPGRWNVVARTPWSIVFTSYKYPDSYFALFQLKSIQGRSLLIGPSRMPVIKLSPEKYLQLWRFNEPLAAFDETKHYGATYVDHLNHAVMLVIREKKADCDLPIQALYHPVKVEKPNLVDDATNDGLKVKGFLTKVVPALLKAAVFGRDAK